MRMSRLVRRTQHIVADVNAHLTAVLFQIFFSCEEFRVERSVTEEYVGNAARDVRALIAE